MRYALNVGEVNIENIISSSTSSETIYPTHPLEDGSIISDTSINLPRGFTISAMCTPLEYRAVQEARVERQECVLFDGDEYIASVYIATVNKTSDAESIELMPLDINLIEVLTVQSLFSDKRIIPNNPAHAPTVEKGEVQGEDPPKSLLFSGGEAGLDFLSGLLRGGQ